MYRVKDLSRGVVVSPNSQSMFRPWRRKKSKSKKSSLKMSRIFWSRNATRSNRVVADAMAQRESPIACLVLKMTAKMRTLACPAKVSYAQSVTQASWRLKHAFNLAVVMCSMPIVCINCWSTDGTHSRYPLPSWPALAAKAILLRSGALRSSKSWKVSDSFECLLKSLLLRLLRIKVWPMTRGFIAKEISMRAICSP